MSTQSRVGLFTSLRLIHRLPQSEYTPMTSNVKLLQRGAAAAAAAAYWEESAVHKWTRQIDAVNGNDFVKPCHRACTNTGVERTNNENMMNEAQQHKLWTEKWAKQKEARRRWDQVHTCFIFKTSVWSNIYRLPSVACWLNMIKGQQHLHFSLKT